MWEIKDGREKKHRTYSRYVRNMKKLPTILSSNVKTSYTKNVGSGTGVSLRRDDGGISDYFFPFGVSLSVRSRRERKATYCNSKEWLSIGATVCLSFSLFLDGL